MNIVVIGVGYVGLVTGTCFAEMGNQVTCIDVDEEKIRLLNKGNIPFYEPGLQEITSRNREEGRLHFAMNYSMVQRADSIFIAVGTPMGAGGAADLSSVEKVAQSVGENLTQYSVIVNKSTVPAGTAHNLQKIITEALFQRGCTIPFDVVSCPEFLKEGSAVNDCMKPDRVIIGSNSKRAIAILRRLYAPFTFNRDRILVMDPKSAEMTKYASNAMLAARISFMNELAGVCEKVGADINQVRAGMSSDQRIRHHFLYAGAGYGGSCFPKDIRALCALGESEGSPMPLTRAVDAVNERQKTHLATQLSTYFEGRGGIAGKVIAVWGLSFKPNTDDMREAPSLTLIDTLLGKGAILQLYDPVAMNSAKKLLAGKKGITFCSSEYQTALGADAIALMTEWPQFRLVNLHAVLLGMRGNGFFDGRNQYAAERMAREGFYYVGIGVPPPSEELSTAQIKQEELDDKNATRRVAMRTCQ